jgi:hypothetical protein
MRARAGWLFIAVGISIAAAAPLLAQDLPLPLCRLVLETEQFDLEDDRLALDLARSNFAAFEEIYKLIEGLWRHEAIPRMAHLEAKHDRDAAELDLQRAHLIVERQEAIVEQYLRVCEAWMSGKSWKEDDEAIDDAHTRFRELQCAILAKDAEIAAVNLEFDRELLTSVLDLRAGEVATRQDVILAELDVTLEEQRLETGKRRAAACQAALPPAREPQETPR